MLPALVVLRTAALGRANVRRPAALRMTLPLVVTPLLFVPMYSVPEKRRSEPVPFPDPVNVMLPEVE